MEIKLMPRYEDVSSGIRRCLKLEQAACSEYPANLRDSTEK